MTFRYIFKFLGSVSITLVIDSLSIKLLNLQSLIGCYEALHIARACQAALEKGRFPDQKIAQKILKKLLADLSEETLPKISYRTLQRNYEIAIHNPDTWEHMVSNKAFDVSNRLSPHKLIARLNGTDLKVKEQLKEFERQTGFKRRTFFKYRKQLGLGD